MAIEAVLFDWGGTLTQGWLGQEELGELWRVAADHLAAEAGCPDEAPRIAERLLEVELAAWDRAVATGRSFRIAELLDEASTSLRLDVAAAVREEAAARHTDAWAPHVRHRPEAGEVLDELRARGWRIGLLSNTHWPRSVHEQFFERDGLGGRFDACCYTCELEHVKPHPEAFRAALASINAKPEATVFVGDRPVDDIGGAAALGMRTVRLTDNAHEVPPGIVPDAEIEDLRPLPAVLDRLA